MHKHRIFVLWLPVTGRSRSLHIMRVMLLSEMNSCSRNYRQFDVKTTENSAANLVSERNPRKGRVGSSSCAPRAPRGRRLPRVQAATVRSTLQHKSRTSPSGDEHTKAMTLKKLFAGMTPLTMRSAFLLLGLYGSDGWCFYGKDSESIWWGSTCYLLRVTESCTKHRTRFLKGFSIGAFITMSASFVKSNEYFLQFVWNLTWCYSLCTEGGNEA